MKSLSRGGRRTRRLQFTLIELLVVVSIISILMSMLLPALAKARRQVKSVMCVTNLRQFALMFGIYADDQDGWIVPDPVNSFGPGGPPPQPSWPGPGFSS